MYLIDEPFMSVLFYDSIWIIFSNLWNFMCVRADSLMEEFVKEELKEMLTQAELSPFKLTR